MALSQSVPSAAVRGPTDRHAAWRAVGYAGVLAAGVLAMFLLAHPYGGLIQDARLYVGYALAALHPSSIGQDMVLAEESQSGFSVFPSLLGPIVGTFGSSLGAKLTALAGLVLWFACAAALSASIAQGRTRWVVLVFLAVLPGAYGGYAVFSFAEALAAPRPFAEAFVLLALALFAAGWTFAAVVPLLLAALFHPIMALPGFAVWGWLVLFDARTRVVKPILGLACVVLAGAGLTAAAALGAPVADRLFATIDPAWREILIARAPYVFVSHWPLADWTRLIVHLATVAIAASLVTGRVRALFVAVAVVAIGGVLASLVFGDWLGSVLVVQVQPWRAAWLVAVFAAGGLALCATALWRQGSVARTALAILVLAWIESGVPVVAIVAACLSLALIFLPVKPGAEFSRVSPVVWGVVGFCAALYLGMHLYAFTLLVISMPEGIGGALGFAKTLNLLAIPFCGLALLWANAKQDARTVATATAVSVALVVSAFLLWDDRTQWHVAVDEFRPDPALAKLSSARAGEVLWVGGGFAVWSQVGRPGWVSWLQGASNVFSRKLAVVWDTRARLLMDLGMVDGRMRSPFGVGGRTSGEEPSLISLSDRALERLCTRPDAPAWLIAPARIMKDGQVSATRWSASLWTAPAAERSFTWEDGAVRWTGARDYVVLACAQ